MRIVLTDQVQQDVYPVTDVESQNTAALNTEKQYYDIQDANIVDESSITAFNGTATNEYQNNNGNPPYNNNPSANANANSTRLYKLNGRDGAKTGLAVTLKVMSGDVVNIFGKSFYHLNSGQNPDNSYLVTNTLLSLLNSFAGSAAVTAGHSGVTGAALNGSPNVTGPLNGWLNGTAHTPPGNTPRAYINWVFLDEQFNPVTTGMSGATRVSDANNTLKPHSATVSITKNGYLYVYCSNESDADVFFDNLQVIHTRGPLLEETHYYPFGGRLAGISSEALNFGSPENKKGYNGNELQNKEFSDGTGLEMYDFNARTYDQQIGRFIQIDPLLEDGQESFTPYHFSFNNPIRYNDPGGQAAEDIRIRGANNSSVTIQTDLIDIDVNAGSLGIDFGGNYNLSGDDILQAGLDIVGIFDPTGIADGINAGISAEKGNWGDAIISGIGLIPYVGDVAKVGKVEKDVKTITHAIDAVKTESKVVKTEEKVVEGAAELPKPPKGPGSVSPANRDPKRVFTKEEKAKMLEKQEGKCAGCGENKTVDQVHGHHVERHADGGKTTIDNGAAVCKDCHKKLHQ